MRLDFRHKQHQPKEVLSLKLPPWMFRIAMGIVGILVLILFLSSLVSQNAATHPYAVFLFAKTDADKPQTKVQFLWVNEQKKQATLIDVPDDVEYTSTTLGTYPVSSIYAARVLSSMSDTDFIRDLSFFFRMPVEGYVQSTGVIHGKIGIVNGLRTFCLHPKNRSFSFSTCLHFVLYSWHPSTAFSENTLPETVFTNVNSSSMRPIDRQQYTQWRKRNLSYQLTGAAKTSIAVINVSGRSGAAGRVSSLFDDFGLHTLMVTDNREKQEKGIVYVEKDKKNEEIVHFIADLLHLPVEENTDKTKESRANIVVVIGEKEAKAFTP